MNEQNLLADSMRHNIRSTKFSCDGERNTLVANDYKEPTIVAYAIENHPCDSRVTMTDEGIVQTLNARMGTGGGNVPFVLLGVDYYNLCKCYAIDSHPGDSRIGIAGDISPTLTVKIAKASSDGPLVLIQC